MSLIYSLIIYLPLGYFWYIAIFLQPEDRQNSPVLGYTQTSHLDSSLSPWLQSHKVDLQSNIDIPATMSTSSLLGTPHIQGAPDYQLNQGFDQDFHNLAQPLCVNIQAFSE